MQVEIDNLKTIKNYALREQVTPSYIYKLVKEKRIKVVVIDGVQFVNIAEFPTIAKK